MSVLPPDMYRNSMEKHHKGDKEINKKELNKVERKLNEESKSVVRIFRVGEGHGQYDRALKNATVHVNGQVPVLQGAEKDHKQSGVEGEIEMRPIVNAMDGPKKTISEIFSDALMAVVEARNDGTLCSSTEELLEAFEGFNKTINDNYSNHIRRIVGSMDAVSLYPNLEANRCAEIILEEVIKSDVTFENIDMHEVGMYLRKNLSSEYIKEEGYEHLLPKKVKNKNKEYKDETEGCNDVYEYIDDIESLFADEMHLDEINNTKKNNQEEIVMNNVERDNVSNDTEEILYCYDSCPTKTERKL